VPLCQRGLDGGPCGQFIADSNYDLTQCRLCWLEYHAKNNRTIRQLPIRLEPCFHLGPVIDRRGRTCSRCWIHQCDVHDRCVLGERVSGLACCADCKDYEA
jgi:hypothetical protein